MVVPNATSRGGGVLPNPMQEVLEMTLFLVSLHQDMLRSQQYSPKTQAHAWNYGIGIEGTETIGTETTPASKNNPNKTCDVIFMSRCPPKAIVQK